VFFLQISIQKALDKGHTCMLFLVFLVIYERTRERERERGDYEAEENSVGLQNKEASQTRWPCQ
jgi:hypothetical protein